MLNLQVQGWTVTLCQEGGTFYATLRLTQWLQSLRAEVYGVNSLDRSQFLRVLKVDGRYSVFGGRLLGGGACCGKMAVKQPNRSGTLTKANSVIESNQALAVKYVEQIEALAITGTFAGLPLKELQDIPISTVENPMYIAKKLLCVLKNDNVWTCDFRFQIRYTLARLARRYLVDYITLNPTIFKSTKEEMKQISDEVENMAAVKQKANSVDSGVLAEFNIMSSMILQLRTNERWWTTIISDASMLLECYSTKDPGPLLVRCFELFRRLQSVITKEAKVERALLIDRLYSTDVSHSLDLFNEIVMDDQPWETRFLALSFIEWGVHRQLLNRRQLESLGPILEHLVQLKDKKVNEKLMTLLLKLGEKGLFSDMLEAIKLNNEDTLNFLKYLPSNILAPETEVGSLNNLKTMQMSMYGRDAELLEAKSILLEQKCITIVGLPGAGKSTLGVRIAQELLSEFEVAWHCNAQDVSSLETDFKTLADALKVELNPKDNYMKLKSMLITFKKVLLVLDNAVKPLEEIYQAFRECGIYLVLTSRNSNLPNSYTLAGWSEDAAAAFMMQKLSEQCSEAEVRQLVGKLSCLPLALDVARKFIQNQRTPIAELLPWLDEDISYFEDGNPQAVKMVQMSIDNAIQQFGEVKLLLCLNALLSGDMIPQSILFPLARTLKAKIDIKRCFRNVKDFSLVTVTEGLSCQMHRIVQQVVLTKFRDYVEEILPKVTLFIEQQLQLDSDNRELLRFTKPILDILISQAMVENFVSFCITFLHHLLAQGTNREKTKALLEVHRVLSSRRRMRTLTSSLLSQMIDMLRSVGNYEEATRYVAPALKHISREQTTKQADIYNNLGLLYKAKGEYDDSEGFFVKSLNIRMEVLDTKHPSIATSYDNLTNLYRDRGELVKAEEVAIKCLQIRKDVLDQNHPQLASSYNTLANLYRDTGDLVRSEEFYLKCLSIRQEVLDPKHPDLAATFNNLALLYKAKGDFPKSEELALKCLNIRQEILDPMHPRLGNSYNNLADLYKAKGNYAKAEEFYGKCLVIREKVLEPNHPHLAVTYSNLANLYKAKGNFNKAEELYAKCLCIRKKALDSKHPHLAATYYHLGELYRIKGDYSRSEKSYFRCLDISQQVLKSQHPDLANYYNGFGILCHNQGNYVEAEEFYGKALRIRKKVLDPEHPDLAESYNCLGVFYYDQGDYMKAEKFHTKSLDILQRVLDPKHPDIATSYNNLARLYQANGDYAKALEFYENSLSIRQEVLCHSHPDLAATYSNLGSLSQAKGEYKQAKKFYVKSLKILQLIHDPNHPDIAALAKNIAEVEVL